MKYPFQAAGFHYGEHALLGLAGHHLVGLHARLTPRYRRHVDVHPDAATGGRLARGAGQPCAAQVLYPDDQPLVQELQARLYEALLLEGVAHLDTGSLVPVAVLGEAGRRQHAHPTDAVAAGAGPQQDRQVPHARGLSQHQALGRQHAQAEDVDQRIATVGLVEHDLASDGRHADGVAVPRHARHHPLGDPAAAGIVQRPEPERVHQGDRPSTHGEDVPQDAAHPRGGALVGLDGRGVVVRLDPDGGGNPVAHIHDAGVLTGTHQNPRCLGGKAPEVDPAALVGTVLGPHDRVHGELQGVGRPTQDLLDPIGLRVSQAEGAVQGLAHGREP